MRYLGEDKITNNLHKSIEIIKKTLEGKIQYKKLLDFILNKNNDKLMNHIQILEEVMESKLYGANVFNNTIIYGPTGVGKYSQMLYFLKKYSPSSLKYENS